MPPERKESYLPGKIRIKSWKKKGKKCLYHERTICWCIASTQKCRIYLTVLADLRVAEFEEITSSGVHQPWRYGHVKAGFGSDHPTRSTSQKCAALLTTLYTNPGLQSKGKRCSAYTKEKECPKEGARSLLKCCSSHCFLLSHLGTAPTVSAAALLKGISVVTVWDQWALLIPSLTLS